MRRQVVAVLVSTSLATLAVFLPSQGIARADLPQQGTGGAQNGPGSVTVSAGNDNNSPGSGTATNTSSGGGNGGTTPCRWTYMGNNSDTLAGAIGGYTGTGPDGGGTFIAPGTQGTWYLKSCPGQTPVSVFVPAGAPSPAPVSPQQLSVQAKNQLRTPAPVIQMSPATTHWQYVHVPSWVWVPASSWVPLTATASVPGVVVTATATPVELDVTYVDGGVSHTVKCRGPGTPYSDALAAQVDPAKPLNAASPTCGWVFQNSSAGLPNEAVPVSAHIVYSASWSVTGAPGGGNLGAVTSPNTVFSVQVAEVQSIVVS
jgi:hypothetical protein